MKSIIFILVFSTIGLSGFTQNIHRIACQGNLTKLDSMLSNTSIDVLDKRGRSLLHWAVACKEIVIFDFLVEKGIYINGEDAQHKTPMHVAVQYGNEQYLDLLIELQPNKDWINRYGASLLEQVVLKKDTAILKKLIQNGVEINSTNERGSTALEIARRIGAKDVTRILLENGADLKMVRTFEMKGKYMGQKTPGDIPMVFAPNFISTEEQEFGSVFNSDATEFYFGVDVNGKNEIRYSKLIKGMWSKPEIFLSDDKYSFNDPFLSPDENRLYFISKRAFDGVGDVKDVDIWYVQKDNDRWSKPINAGLNINSSRNEYYISFTNDGTMYFSSNVNASDENLNSDYDIYYSKSMNGKFQKPIALGEMINSKEYEADVFVAPDESYMIFCSTRENGFGRGDLYVSFKNEDNEWSTAISMGKEINTHNYEYCPFVTKDGKYLFYTSNQDIYWVSTRIMEQLKKNIR